MMHDKAVIELARGYIEYTTAIYTERHVMALADRIQQEIDDFLNETYFGEEEPDGTIRDGMRGFTGGKL